MPIASIFRARDQIVGGAFHNVPQPATCGSIDS